MPHTFTDYTSTAKICSFFVCTTVRLIIGAVAVNLLPDIVFVKIYYYFCKNFVILIILLYRSKEILQENI